MVTKDRPELTKAEVKILQVCLSMQVLLPPPEKKNVKRESYLLTTTKANCKSDPPDLHAPACRKNAGILHTSQTKHDSQNILGCVRQSDLVKTYSNNFMKKLFWF